MTKIGQTDSRFYIWDAVTHKLKSFSLPTEPIKLPLNIDTDKEVVVNGAEAIIKLEGRACFNLDC